jgi:hypothetical protein
VTCLKVSKERPLHQPFERNPMSAMVSEKLFDLCRCGMFRL